jgi:hypothetical protein
MATTKAARTAVKNDLNTLKDDLKVLGAEEKARLREKAATADARVRAKAAEAEARMREQSEVLRERARGYYDTARVCAVRNTMTRRRSASMKPSATSPSGFRSVPCSRPRSRLASASCWVCCSRAVAADVRRGAGQGSGQESRRGFGRGGGRPRGGSGAGGDDLLRPATGCPPLAAAAITFLLFAIVAIVVALVFMARSEDEEDFEDEPSGLGARAYSLFRQRPILGTVAALAGGWIFLRNPALATMVAAAFTEKPHGRSRRR